VGIEEAEPETAQVKRTALQRKTPLRRSGPPDLFARSERRKPIRHRRIARRRSSREYDPEYMLEWVKKQPCVARSMSPCEGEVEADHAGKRGLGQKCSDRETIPLCTLHHRQRTDFSGPFKNWNRDEMRGWLDHWIHYTQLEHERFARAVDRAAAGVAESASGELPRAYLVSEARRSTFRQEG
jgi:hypothetical protein